MADLSGSISLHNHCDTPTKCPGKGVDHTLYRFLQPECCFPSPGRLGLLEGKKKERVVWLLQCLEASESFGSSCNGITCPGEGAWSSHLGAPQPRRQWLRHVVPLDVVWGSGTARVENSRGALLLPSVCSSLSPGLCPSCCCADADICLLILSARVCTTSTGSAPAFSTQLYQSLGFAPGLCLTTGPCPGHLMSPFPLLE